jgi:hypothetical protein
MSEPQLENAAKTLKAILTAKYPDRTWFIGIITAKTGTAISTREASGAISADNAENGEPAEPPAGSLVKNVAGGSLSAAGAIVARCSRSLS